LKTSGLDCFAKVEVFDNKRVFCLYLIRDATGRERAFAIATMDGDIGGKTAKYRIHENGFFV
jgi:hypothetical protein